MFFRGFKKFSSKKFHENPSRGSRSVPCGRTDRQQTDRDMTKLISTFRNFMIAPENGGGGNRMVINATKVVAAGRGS
jgi:hypothetical protein